MAERRAAAGHRRRAEGRGSRARRARAVGCTDTPAAVAAADSSARATRPRGALDDHQDQILEELNVKPSSSSRVTRAMVTYRIKPNLPVLGKRRARGKQIPAIRRNGARRRCGWRRHRARRRRRRASSSVAGDDRRDAEPTDVLVETEAAGGFACAEDGGYLTELDTTLRRRSDQTRDSRANSCARPGCAQAGRPGGFGPDRAGRFGLGGRCTGARGAPRLHYV